MISDACAALLVIRAWPGRRPGLILIAVGIAVASAIDFYIRSAQQNPKNKPAREVFVHFFGMEITWK